METKKPDIAVGNYGRTIVLRLKPGMKIGETLKQVMTDYGMEYAIIVNGVGAIKQARIRNLLAFAKEFPISDDDRIFVNTPGPLELLSLQGSISRKEDGEIVVHGHVVFCGVQPSGAALGGHFAEAEVYSTTEITIVEALNLKLLRAICPETLALELKPVNE